MVIHRPVNQYAALQPKGYPLSTYARGGGYSRPKKTEKTSLLPLDGPLPPKCDPNFSFVRHCDITSAFPHGNTYFSNVSIKLILSFRLSLIKYVLIRALGDYPQMMSATSLTSPSFGNPPQCFAKRG